MIGFSHESITIRNGFLTGLAGGAIQLFMEGCLLEDLMIVANGNNGIQVAGSCEIANVIVDRNFGAGIFNSTFDSTASDSPIDDVTVRESVLSRNRREGVFSTIGTGVQDRVTVLESAISGNGDNGLDLRTQGVVRHCAIFSNAGGGIDIGTTPGQLHFGRVEGNAFRSNLHAFVFDPAVGFLYNHIDTNNTNPSSGGQEMDLNFCVPTSCL